LFEGDQAGLVGPNGSGKSTLLAILAGIHTADLVSGLLHWAFAVSAPARPGYSTSRAALITASTCALSHALQPSGIGLVE